MKRFIGLGLLVLLTAVVAACGGDDDSPDGEETPADDTTLRIVTTVAPITSLAENIAGDKAIVTGIVPEGTNSHTFESPPSDARVMAQADLIIMNGLRLEEPSRKLAEANKRADAEIVKLGDLTITEDDWKFDFSFPKEDGDPNPHLWPNVPFADKYALIIYEKIVALDPANKPTYDANYAALNKRLDAFDAALKFATATVPEENRKLLTYHDSWAYWADTYGYTVVGAAQPSDFTEPSSKDIADLIQQVKAEEVPAVFGSEVFPSETLETIAAESGAKYIDELRDDDLPGGPGDENHSYIGLMLANMEIMLPALGGNTDALAEIDPSLVFEGESRATYPQ